MDDKKFPKIKKSIEDFIYEEEGNIGPMSRFSTS